MTNTKTNPYLPAAPRAYGNSSLLSSSLCTMRNSASRILHSAFVIAAAAAMTVGSAFAIGPDSISTQQGSHTYAATETIYFVYSLDDNITGVTGDTKPYLVLNGILNPASSQPRATYKDLVPGVNGDAMRFEYTVRPGEFSAGVGIASYNRNGATIATDDGNFTANSLPDTDYILAGETVSIETIAFTSTGTKTMAASGNTGTTLDIGISLGGDAPADQSFTVSASTSGKATFPTSFTILAGDASGTCTLTLSAATDDPVTITFHPTAYGNDVTAGDLKLTLSVTEAAVPHIEAVQGDYNDGEVFATTCTAAGEDIMILVKMNEIVTDVSGGVPYLEVNVEKGTGDSRPRQATYLGKDGEYLEFSYTVQAGDFVEDLDVKRQGFKLGAATITLSGGGALSSRNARAVPYGTAAGSLSSKADIAIRTVAIASTGELTQEISGREGEELTPITITRGGSADMALGFTLTPSESGKLFFKKGTEWVDLNNFQFSIPRGEESADLQIQLVEQTTAPMTLTLHPNGYPTGNNGAPGPGDIVLTISIDEGTKPAIILSGSSQMQEGTGTQTINVSLARPPKESTTVSISALPAGKLEFLSSTSLTWASGDTSTKSVTVRPLDGNANVTINATTTSTAYSPGSLDLFIENVNPTLISPPAEGWEPPAGGEGFAYTVGWSGTDVDADRPSLYAVIHWGDGNSNTYTDSPQGSATHTYDAPGTYGITVEIHDKDYGVATAAGSVEIAAAVRVIINEHKAKIPEDVGQNGYKGLQGLGRGTIDDRLDTTTRNEITPKIDYEIKYSPATAAASLVATPDPRTALTLPGLDSNGNSGSYNYDSFFHVWLGDEETFLSKWCLVPLTAPVTAGIKLRDGGDAQDRQVHGVFAREHYPEDGCADIDWDELPDEWEHLVWQGTELDPLPFESTAAPYGRADNPDLDFFPACVQGIDATTGDFILHTDPDSRSDFTPVGIPFINVYEVRGTHRGLNMDRSSVGAAAEAVEPQDEPHCGSYDEEGVFTDNGQANKFFPWFGTDPTNPDTDNDKLTDGYEYFFWRLAKFSPDSFGEVGSFAEKYDPTMVIEGIPISGDLVAAAFNPCVENDHLAGDFDGDGLSDFEEFLLGTNPVHWDTDRDQMNDGWEVMWGLNPKNFRDWKENPDGDFMANDAKNHFHADVYVEYGFDPRTAWNATYLERNRGLALPAPNTAPYSNYHEHYLARWSIDHGFAPVPEEGERGEVIPLSWDFMTQPVPSGMLHFYNPDPYWTGPRHVPNYALTPNASSGGASGDGASGDGASGAAASGTSYVLPVGDVGYIVEAIEVTTHGCDSDEDGIPDGWELYLCSSDGENLDGLWPISAPDNRQSAQDAGADFDGDSLPNKAEFRSVETCDYYASVCSNGVFNFTGNWYNKWWPSNPFNEDTDSDGLPDGFEGDGTFTYQVSFEYSDENPSAGAWIAAQVCDTERNLTFGQTTMLRGHVPGGGLNPCAVDTDMDYLPDYWEYLYAGFYRDPDWAGGFCNQPGTETGIELRNGMPTIELFGAGMDGTYFDSRTGFDECSHKENRNFDYDGDGLENYQEYWINGVRHFQYDKWVAGGGYGDYDIQEIFDTGRFSETLAPAVSFKNWKADPVKLPDDPLNPATGAVSELFMKWDWSAWADDWQNEGKKAPSGFYPFHYMPAEPRPLFLLYASTDPRLADSDADGMDDFYEMFHGLNPILSDVIDYCSKPEEFPLESYDYDFRTAPWMAGMPNADPDGDDIPNWEESLSPDQPAPANHNTDPSPLWFTDMSYDRSFVNLYYDWGLSAANYWTVEGLMEPYEYYPEPGAMFPGLMDPRPHYVFDFECTEGFDTDNDNFSDRYETIGSAGGVTDAQNPDRPIGRKALYLDGNAAARTRSLCAFGPNALRSWTIEAWVMPAEPATGSRQVILERPVAWDESNAEENTVGGVRRTFRLGLNETGLPFVEFNNGGKTVVTEFVAAPEGGALLANKWYHLAATMDGFQKKLTLYVDGRRVASKATSTIPYTGFTDTALNAVGSQEYHQPRWSPLVIGASDANPFGQVDGSFEYYNGSVNLIPGGQPALGDFFKGWIDEVRIWDGARPGGEDAGDQRVAFWRWPTIRDDYEALKRYGLDETIKAREDGAQYLARIVDYRQGILDAKRPFSAAANFVTPAAGSTNSTASTTNATALAASAAPLPQGMTFDEYRVEASTYILMTGGEDTVCRIPPHLLCVYNFDTLPATSPTGPEPPVPVNFDHLETIRPDDYTGTPWWEGAADRSTVYTSVEAQYTFPQYIQNLVAWQPLGVIIREENGAMDEEYVEITGGTNGIPLFVYQPDHVVNSKYWTRYTKAGKPLSELESYADYGADAVNTFPNSANPYGYRYETGLIVGAENHPLTQAQEAYDPEYAVLFNDMLPLRNARADMSIQLWDDPTGDNIGVNKDSDGDGIPDYWEVAHGMDPHNADQNGNGVSDEMDDFDGDGLTNWYEFLANTDPFDMTTDGLLLDASADPDGDGLTNLQEQDCGTHPLHPDSDDDGWIDGYEVAYGSNPLDSLDPYRQRALMVAAEGYAEAKAARYQVKDSFTLSASVNPSAYPASGVADIVSYEIGEGVWNYFVRLDPAGIVTAGFTRRDGSGEFTLSAPTLRALALNAWTRVSLSYDYANRLATLLLDDEPVASVPVNAQPAIYSERILQPVKIGEGFAGMIRNVLLTVPGESGPRLDIRFDDGTAFDPAAGTDTYGVPMGDELGGQAEDFALATTNVPYGSVEYRLLPETAATLVGNAAFVFLDENLVPMDDDHDADGDGLPDQWEIANGLNPYNADTDGNGVTDDLEDPDLDGLTNETEYLAGTDPNNAKTDGSTFDGDADPDRDGLTNILEQLYGTDPLNPDTDDDGASDGQEVFGAYGYFTLPTSALSPVVQGIFFANGTPAAFTDNSVLSTLRICKSWTIEAWVKNATAGVIVRRGEDATGVNYELGLEGGKPYARIAGLYDGAVDPALSVKAIADFAVKSDVWTHIAAVWNDDSRTLAVYVDGVLAANVYKREIDLGVFAQDGLAPVVVGDGLSGYLDEVRIWDIARSGVSIAATAFQTFEHAPAQPLVELRFDDFGETAENFGSAGGFLVGGLMLDGTASPRTSPIAADEFVDADGDQIPDFWEIAIFGSTMACDPAGDEDEDGLSNLYEYYSHSFPLTKYTGDPAYGTGENASLVSDANRDPDGDGLSNLSEQTLGTRPDLADTDDDGWSDYEEVNGTTRGRNKVGVSDPLNALSPAIPRAAKFTGAGAITVPQRDGRWLASWTVAAWVKPDAANADGTVVARTYGEGSFNYALGVENVSGVLTPYAQYTTEAPDNNLGVVKVGVDEAPTFRDDNADWLTLKAGEWTHIAASYTATNVVGTVTNGLLTLYIDGTAVAWRQDALTEPFFGVGELVVGKDFKGLIDDVRVITHAVSENDLVSIMGGGPISAPPATASRAASAEVAAKKSAAIAGDYIVRFRDGVTKAASAASVTALGGNVRRTYNIINAAHVTVPQGADEEAFVAALRADPTVLYVEPNLKRQIFKAPNDTDYTKLWGLHNNGQTGGTAGCDIKAEDAWEYLVGSKEIVVAVIDTGVDYNHPDLAANMWQNPGEIAGNGVDDDGNGYVDDVYGYDFADGDSDPMDDHSHGTHCSGTIGAVGNNGQGVAGVNWSVRIMACKAATSAGTLPSSAIIAAIDYAVQMGARVSNNSYGGYGFSQAEYDAVKAAGEAGMVFVASAGNDANDNDGAYQAYPASFDLDCVIAVAATDSRDGIASFSNYGATTVDLGAPGVDIWSTIPTSMGSYGNMSGTSMAGPHVTGAAALILAADPTLTVSAVKSLLLEYADPVDSLNGKCVSGGRLNVGAIIPVVFNPGGDLPVPVSARGLAAHLRFDDGGQTVRDFARAFDFRRPGAYVGALSGGVTLVTDGDEDLVLERLFSDTDEDGLPDWWEEMVGTNPANPTDGGGRNGDPDGDGLSNFYEFRASLGAFHAGNRGLDPFNPDTDNDGISDYDEDSDGDGLTNGEEQDAYLSDPGSADADDDGVGDGDELGTGFDPTDSAAPYVSRALTFSGVSGDANTVVVKDKVDGVFTERFSSEEWTVEAWVNPAAASLSGEYPLVSRALFATGGLNYELGITGGKPYVRYTAHDASAVAEVIAGGAITASTWTHLAARFDADQASASSGTLTLFVNGEPVAMKDVGIIPATGPGDLVFGSSGFKGQMFDVRVWKIPQTDASIKGMMQSELLGGKIEGMSGILTVNGNGFLKEAATTLKANGDPIDLLEDSWTVEAWIKTTGNSGLVIARRNHSETTADDFNYAIQMNPDGSLRGRFAIWFLYVVSRERDNDGNETVTYATMFDFTVNDLVGEMRVNDGQWHHVAYVRTATQCKLYVDGLLDASQGALLLPAGYEIVDYGIRAAPGPVVIGEGFTGSLEETRIWNRDLSTAEIGLYSHQNLAGSENGLIQYFTYDFEPDDRYVTEHATVRDNVNEKGVFIRTLLEEAFVDTETSGPENFRNSPIRSLQNLSLSGAFIGRDGGETVEDRTNPMAYGDFHGVKYAGVFGSGVSFATQSPISWTQTVDSDGDGMPDVWEVTNGLDPYNSDQDGNGIPDGFDDFDSDGLRNEAEWRAGLDPWNPDTDRDGTLDFDDVPASLSSTPFSYGWLYTDADYVLDGYEYQWEDSYASPYRYDEDEDRDLDGWNNWSEALVGTALAYNSYNEPVVVEDGDADADASISVAEASVADKAANFPVPDLTVTLDYYGRAIKGAKLVIHAYSHEDMNGLPDAVFVKDFSSDTLDTWPMTVTVGRESLVYGHIRQGRNWFYAWFDGAGAGAGAGASAGAGQNAGADGSWPTWSAGEPAAIADNQLDGIDIGFDRNEVTFHLTDKAESFARFSWEGQMPEGDVHVAMLYSGNAVFDRVIKWPRTWLHEGDIVSWNNEQSGQSGSNFGLGALEETVSANDEVVRGIEVVLTPQGNFEGDQWSIAEFCVVSNWMHSASALAKPALYGPIGREIVADARPEFQFSLDPEFSEFRFRILKRRSESDDWTSPIPVVDERFLAPGRFWNDATHRRDLVIFKSPISVGDVSENIVVFERGKMYQWIVTGYSPAVRSGVSSAVGYFITSDASSSETVHASGGKGVIDVSVSYPSGMAYQGSAAPFIRVQAFRSKSFNGLPDASVRIANAANCRITGLEEGESYFIRAYVEQGGDALTRDKWESWGYYRAGNGAVNPFMPVAVKATMLGNASSRYAVTIRDCDTDNDLLPDAYEWAKVGNFTSYGVANYAPSVKQTVAYAVSPLAIAAADPLCAGAGYTLIANGIDPSADEDDDGFSNGLEDALGLDAETPQSLKITSVSFNADGNPVLDWAIDGVERKRDGNDLRSEVLYEIQAKVSLTDPEWTTIRTVSSTKAAETANLAEKPEKGVDISAFRFFRVKLGTVRTEK